jgi:hypothetical protein
MWTMCKGYRFSTRGSPPNLLSSSAEAPLSPLLNPTSSVALDVVEEGGPDKSITESGDRVVDVEEPMLRGIIIDFFRQFREVLGMRAS